MLTRDIDCSRGLVENCTTYACSVTCIAKSTSEINDNQISGCIVELCRQLKGIKLPNMGDENRNSKNTW